MNDIKGERPSDLAGRPAAPIRLLGGSGPDVLLIHGFGSDRMSWVANAPAIQERHRVSAVDLPGHGAAGVEVGDGALVTLADAVERAWAGQGPAVLVGHSLGGGIALILAERRPDLFRRLVLIAPAGLGQGVDAAFLKEFPRSPDAAGTEALLHRLVNRPRLINKQLVALVQRQLAVPGARDALERIAGGIGRAGPDLDRAASGVRGRDLPRMVVWGEDDQINPLDRGKVAAFGGETLLLPETGHLPHIEAAPAVNAAILDFLARRHDVSS